MAAIALAWIVVPLLRRPRAAGVERERGNLAILRDQRRELEADLANAVVTSEQYEEAVSDLDRRVLEESLPEGAGATAPAPTRSGKLTAVLISVAMPVAAAFIYLLLGTPAALDPSLTQQQARATSSDAHQITPDELDRMLARLAGRLEQEPDNAEGWSVLARGYAARSKPQEAIRAFERAAALLPNDAALLADYADTLALAQGHSLAGKPMELVERALKVDPRQWKALALAGTAAFNARDFKQAASYWERARDSVPPTSPIAQSLDASIAEARQLGGLGTPAAALKAPPVAATASKVATAPSATRMAEAGVAGTVTLAPALASAARPDDTVYIFARAAQGSRMPLALLRKQVKDLPLAFTLDDTMAMTPDMKLSNFAEVVVGARVSKTGSASPQKGDLEALSPAVRVGSKDLAIVIDQVVP